MPRQLWEVMGQSPGSLVALLLRHLHLIGCSVVAGSKVQCAKAENQVTARDTDDFAPGEQTS